MFCCDKIKLNKFKKVAIPKNRDYVSRFGFASVPGSQYTGDNVAPVNQTKIQELIEADQMLNEHSLDE